MSFLHHAPVQGHTDAAFRHFLNLHYPVDARHYTPFIRVEHGAVRDRDIRDITSPLNSNCDVTAQVIFRDIDELNILVSTLTEKGISKIDLNVGCPFPLQTARGRGAAMIANTSVLEAAAGLLADFPDVDFSMKMRLGFRQNDEWRASIDAINKLPLSHVTMHPRIARQQYTGTPDLDAFSIFLKSCAHPVIYNGDLRTPADIADIIKRFPDIAGVMCGRGELARPSLFTEYISGEEWSRENRLEKMLRFHRDLLGHYCETLCGDAQILSKIKPFWEYAEEEIGRKALKAISKANTMPKYRTAIASID